MSEPEPWASSGALTLGLGFGSCPSDRVGLKKSVRTQPDGHTKKNESFKKSSLNSDSTIELEESRLIVRVMR
jgi:hypothetical protein